MNNSINSVERDIIESGIDKAENAAMLLGCEYHENIMDREQSQEEEDYLFSKAEEEWESYMEETQNRLEDLAMIRYDEIESWEVFESGL